MDTYVSVATHNTAGNEIIKIVNSSGTTDAIRNSASVAAVGAINLSASLGGVSFVANAAKDTAFWTGQFLVIIQNTTNDALGARLRFVSNDSSVGADDDVLGNIEFYGDDDGSTQTLYANIRGEVIDASNGTEGGALAFQVASHNGTLTTGLEIMDGDASGELDVEIGAGTASVTTVAGRLDIVSGLGPKTAVADASDSSSTSALTQHALSGKITVTLGHNWPNEAGFDIALTNNKIEVDSVVVASCSRGVACEGTTIADGSCTIALFNETGAQIDSAQTFVVNYRVL